MVTPAPPKSKRGNRITAVRWAGLLRELNHHVEIAESYGGQQCDALIALHARRSAKSIAQFHRDHSGKPLILALTGTDLYRDIFKSPTAKRSLELASRLIVLQPDAIRFLPQRHQSQCRVIIQSVKPLGRKPPPLKTVFEVCVVGHLRPVKDPFRAAMAAKLLPDSSCIRIVHLGAALSNSMERRAIAEMNTNPRYQWLGELSHGKTLQRLARSRLLVLSSKLEGGANVTSEAVAADVPVISSNISGSIGLLGEDYPGYFPVGNTRKLAELLQRTEEDHAFYRSLQTDCRRLKKLITPTRERESWRELLAEL
ncbi:MAG: TIGR04348 family glycosyltransferase [Planctomycetes bacterium]|nr:TIGR04348 family glycosyltransferase [Planctomycetota bacterium]